MPITTPTGKSVHGYHFSYNDLQVVVDEKLYRSAHHVNQYIVLDTAVYKFNLFI